MEEHHRIFYYCNKREIPLILVLLKIMGENKIQDQMELVEFLLETYAFPGTPGTTNHIEYVTIATLGDAQDFGDLTRKGVQVWKYDIINKEFYVPKWCKS